MATVEDKVKQKAVPLLEWEAMRGWRKGDNWDDYYTRWDRDTAMREAERNAKPEDAAAQAYYEAYRAESMKAFPYIRMTTWAETTPAMKDSIRAGIRAAGITVARGARQ